MAYDMVQSAGRKGREATGVFAAGLRGVHATRGQKSLNWDWEFEGMKFSARPASCDVLPEIMIPDTHQERVYALSSPQWLDKIQGLPVPDPSGQLSLENPDDYPDPELTIESASLLVLEVATLLSNVQNATICWNPGQEGGVEVSLDASGFTHKQTKRNVQTWPLYK